METKTKYTATDTLNVVKNLTKKRLYELMNEGKISYEQEVWGNKTRRVIDASELLRVFGSNFVPLGGQETIQETILSRSEKPTETQKNTLETMYLTKEIELLREQLQYERKEKERERLEFSERERYYRSQAEKLMETVTQQTKLLENSHQSDTQKPTEPRKGFFDRWIR